MSWRRTTARVPPGRMVIGWVGAAGLVIAAVVALWARAARGGPPDFGWALEEDDDLTDGLQNRRLHDDNTRPNVVKRRTW